MASITHFSSTEKLCKTKKEDVEALKLNFSDFSVQQWEENDFLHGIAHKTIKNTVFYYTQVQVKQDVSACIVCVCVCAGCGQ